MKKNKRGGKRKGAGRKKLSKKDRGFALSLWIKPEQVNYDNPKEVRQYLYECIKYYSDDNVGF